MHGKNCIVFIDGKNHINHSLLPPLLRNHWNHTRFTQAQDPRLLRSTTHPPKRFQSLRPKKIQIGRIFEYLYIYIDIYIYTDSKYYRLTIIYIYMYPSVRCIYPIIINPNENYSQDCQSFWDKDHVLDLSSDLIQRLIG